MRCLYCGKQLALLKRLTGGGEFCSDAHKQSYQEEYNRLALSRLLQAQSKPGEIKTVHKPPTPADQPLAPGASRRRSLPATEPVQESPAPSRPPLQAPPQAPPQARPQASSYALISGRGYYQPAATSPAALEEPAQPTAR